ncbi:MAG: hypothetical protein IRY94_18000, partial [Rhodospirillaceae bacterium]|nr:hypothetical protein [Rhodospirillaceae bacterium]
MDDLDKLTPQAAEAPSPARKSFGRGRTALFVALAAVAAVLAGGLATNAFS